MSGQTRVIAALLDLYQDSLGNTHCRDHDEGSH